MKLIPTTIHGYLDYIVSALLIVSPWLLGFANNGTETWVPVALGCTSILYSIFTNYELGAVKVISMRKHLLLDFLSGVALSFSPWIFGFSQDVWAPHLVIGVLEMIVVALSISISGTEVKQRQFSDLGSTS
jgi:type IV secretory pathway VirB6-like protein